MKPLNNQNSLLEYTYNLIEKALSESKTFSNILKNSVFHDNGFSKIVLMERSSSEIGCRIHNWLPGSSDSNVHTHRWDMASFVLDGSYFANNYKVSKEGEEYQEYFFTPTNNKEYRLDFKGLIKLTPKEDKPLLLKKNDFYRIERGEIHKINQVSDQGALTAVLSWGEALESASVFSKKDILKKEFNQSKLSKKEVEANLQKAFMLLKQHLLLAV